MDQKRLLELINKVKEGQASSAEILELDNLYGQFEEKKGYIEHLDPDQKIAYRELIFDRIHSALPQPSAHVRHLKTKRLRLFRFWTAASILLLLGVVAYLYMMQSENLPMQDVIVESDTVISNDKPVLILANGRKINLDEANVGILAASAGVVIRKTADGEIIYENNEVSSNTLTYNTIEIPRGQRYQIQLPDGSKVWLNAMSSLRYPSAFSGKKREVKLIGEGYFEIASEKTKQFVVKSRGQVIGVLGTHFNINSYPDEDQTKTTLLEGSVKIMHRGQTVILKPGQQATSTDDFQDIKVSSVDLEEVVAWKRGEFIFENADIRYIMRHLARRYDIVVEYQGEKMIQKFGGAFQHTSSLDELLKYLESYGDVRFKREGRRVIVMK